MQKGYCSPTTSIGTYFEFQINIDKDYPEVSALFHFTEDLLFLIIHLYFLKFVLLEVFWNIKIHSQILHVPSSLFSKMVKEI